MLVWEVEKAYHCFFIWKINYPFLPKKLLQTTFYHEAPSITKWVVKLQPIFRQHGVWRFTFVLEFDSSSYKRDSIFTELLIIRICLDEVCIDPVYASGYCFSPGNQLQYHSQMDVTLEPGIEPRNLVIEIDLSLRDGLPLARNRGLKASRLLCDDGDLIALSRDLEQLRTNGHYSNMDLSASDGSVFRAHSYIIHARWNNFFLLHPFYQTRDATVALDISANLLSDILTYIYSGKFHRRWPDWKNVRYITELFQVIDCYQMYHFYNVFVKSDCRLVCQTQKTVFKFHYIFGLSDVGVPPVLAICFNCSPPIQPENTMNVMLEIQVRRWGGNDACIWYTLQSTSETEIYARLTIETTQSRDQLTSENHMGQEWNPVHDADHVFGPNGLVESEPVISVGSQYPDEEKTEILRWYRFTISYTDGTTTDNLQSYNNSSQDELPRLNALSDHMYDVCLERIPNPPIMKARCCDDNVCFPFHKAIFAARVPYYFPVITEMSEDEDQLPEIITTYLSREALYCVTQYIYTGKMPFLPQNRIQEMWNFAKASQFDCFRNFLEVRGNPEVE